MVHRTEEFFPHQLHNLASLSLEPEQGHHFKISITSEGSLIGQPLRTLMPLSSKPCARAQEFLLWDNYSFSEDIISQQSNGMPDSN